jgi:hypothetical protein
MCQFLNPRAGLVSMTFMPVCLSGFLRIVSAGLEKVAVASPGNAS